ncbi:putative disease resistance RPP13-like protein 1 [Pistacia vera]|uniref:putative disease resistance RPP13-like protein 1 n=1 Tax=Pistacia vera TaxID=55513 RepID=UPI001262F431|nr:putative disease resistance RPP13-like protein 1 [Pistacia vera]
MGGVGKTTLAQEVYNDRAVEDFDPKAWVCVSDDFDVLRISKAILESVTLSPCDLKDLNQVQIQLYSILVGRKFLLVLDDVWSKSYELWQALKSPFMAGAPGSKIIVTTRNVEVALTMGPLEYYNLKLLSDDDCWTLFKRHAFESRDTEMYGSLELIREKVVEKCKGLPLAARALGGLLRSKQRLDEWEDILNNKIWNLADESEIPAVLKLSYNHLPSHLKRCFAYCAIFPKDYEFEEKELIPLWMAEGLIQQFDNNKQSEDLGGEYFWDLLSRSIFQQSSSNSSKYIMHDLVNDLAQWASGESCFRLENETKSNIQLQRYEKARYSSYTCAFLGDSKDKFEVFKKVTNLRTFLPISLHSRPRFISHTVLFDLLPKFKKLRVLSLMHYYIPELPDSIGSLKLLRYLNLCNTYIRSLPESICSLLNLQMLILRDCFYLKKLPSNMGNLINLHHLDIRGANLLAEMPIGITRLKYLRTLTDFIVGKGVGSSLKDLKNLTFLRGELCISRIENATDLQNSKEAILVDKKDLKVLTLEWGSQLDDLRNKAMEENLLDILQPNRNLKELTIKRYCGIKFPSWIGDPSFSNMVLLRLDNCEKCTSLPSIGLLNSLKYLTIRGMRGLKSISSEIYGNRCSKPFTALETLRLENLQEWEHWNVIKENERVEVFSGLRELFIFNCPKLSGRIPEHLPSLTKLVIRECAQLMVSFSSFPMLCDLEIAGCKGMFWGGLADSKSLKSMAFSNISETGNWLTQSFRKVEHLNIYSEELVHFWMNQICLENSLAAGLHSFTPLRVLCIQNWSSLVYFPDACFLPILTKLEIRNCNGLTSFVRGQLPSSLKELHIGSCEKLELLLDDKEDISASSSSSTSLMYKEKINNTSTSLLESLSIGNCPSLTCLSSKGQLPAVKVLEISTCPKLRTLSLNGQLPESLEVLRIRNCSQLESIAESFHNNTSLRDIAIRSCYIKFIPDGLHYLSRLQQISIGYCPNILSFPNGGFPSTSLTVALRRCDQLLALPDNMHWLSSLGIRNCQSLILSPEKGFSANLTSLTIEGVNIYKPLVQWGLHKLISLRELRIVKCSEVMSFPEEVMGMMLPASLTSLKI